MPTTTTTVEFSEKEIKDLLMEKTQTLLDKRGVGASYTIKLEAEGSEIKGQVIFSKKEKHANGD